MITLYEERDGKKWWKAHGESTMDVARFIASNRKNVINDVVESTSGTYGMHKWTLGHDFAHVQRLAAEGWTEGALDLADRLSATLPMRDRDSTWRYDVAGERPDVGRFLSGDPANMMRHGHPKGHIPVVTLAINVWIRCDVKAQNMANYGAAVCAMIDRLENAGRRVEVIAMVTAPQGNDHSEILSASWTVKHAQDAVDYGALAFSLVHPGASRRFGWAVWDRLDIKQCDGHGAGVGYKATLDDLISPSPNTLIMTGLNSDPYRCATIEDALVFVRDQINLAAGETLVEVE